MEILARRSGGQLGIPQELGPVDTNRIKNSQASVIHEVVEKADFFNLPSDLGGEPRPDTFHTALTVADGQRRHTVGWTDTASAPAVEHLNELLHWMQQLGNKWEPVAT